MDYELVSLSVTIDGKLFKKDENHVLNDKKLPKTDLDAAFREGYIMPKGSKCKTSKEVRKLYQEQLKKVQDGTKNSQISENEKRIAETKKKNVENLKDAISKKNTSIEVLKKEQKELRDLSAKAEDDEKKDLKAKADFKSIRIKEAEKELSELEKQLENLK